MGSFEDGLSLIECSGKSTSKESWSDIKEKYPDSWILFTDIEIVKDDREFLLNLIEVCTDDNYEKKRIDYLNSGVNVLARRTTSWFNGVLGGQV